MKALVVYDSVYGNTREIAETIAKAIGAKSAHVDKADIKGFDTLIVGSPTHAGRPSPAMKTFLSKLPKGSLEGVGFAAFDTRASSKDSGFFLKLFMGILGYAAPRIGSAMRKLGGKELGLAEGFAVMGKEGPLKDGELERAAAWAMKLVG